MNDSHAVSENRSRALWIGWQPQWPLPHICCMKCWGTSLLLYIYQFLQLLCSRLNQSPCLCLPRQHRAPPFSFVLQGCSRTRPPRRSTAVAQRQHFRFESWTSNLSITIRRSTNWVDIIMQKKIIAAGSISCVNAETNYICKSLLLSRLVKIVTL